jgi:hypothetical protein
MNDDHTPFPYVPSLAPTTTSKSWKHTTPTHVVRRYPEADDNEGRVTDGTARHLRDQAEAWQNGSQPEAIAALRTQKVTKAQRRARSGK